jgi:hypothetical protein
MNDEERGRAEAFHQRLKTPIGELEEDRTSAAGAEILSPFRVVGISIILIGLMMLGVLYWVTGPLAFGLDLGFGALLVLLGAAMIRGTGRDRTQGTNL